MLSLAPSFCNDVWLLEVVTGFCVEGSAQGILLHCITLLSAVFGQQPYCDPRGHVYPVTQSIVPVSNIPWAHDGTAVHVFPVPRV